MKKIIAMLCLLVLFTGCTQDKKESKKETGKDTTIQETSTDNDNKKFEVKILESKANKDGIKFESEFVEYLKFKTKITNETDRNFMTGVDWSFFYRESDKEEWKNATPDYLEYTQEGLIIAPKESRDFELDMGKAFENEELKAGQYKVEKGIREQDSEGEYSKEYKVELIFEMK